MTWKSGSLPRDRSRVIVGHTSCTEKTAGRHCLSAVPAAGISSLGGAAVVAVAARSLFRLSPPVLLLSSISARSSLDLSGTEQRLLPSNRRFFLASHVSQVTSRCQATTQQVQQGLTNPQVHSLHHHANLKEALEGPWR